LVGGQVFGSWSLFITNASLDSTYNPYVYVQAKFGSTAVGSQSIQLSPGSVSGGVTYSYPTTGGNPNGYGVMTDTGGCVSLRAKPARDLR
jgi:hypothetical protein